MSLYTFTPLFQERIWGGQALRALFGRSLPEGRTIGESWELVDRPEAVSGIVGEQRTLHDLWTGDRERFFGRRAPRTERFPILIKLLDCRETLSVQVHPPAAVAAHLGGEPKSELWYFLHTEPGAKVYAGFRAGVTRERFNQAVGTAEFSALLHEIPTEASEAMFIPSGRIHAIGGGNVLLEIQQNSDTTYRIDDWGRVDAEGKPRALHRSEAAAAIRFDDFTPTFTQPHGEKVVACDSFSVFRVFLFSGEFRTFEPKGETFHYHFVAQGAVRLGDREFKTGDGWLVSADQARYDVTPLSDGAELVTVRFP